MPTEEDGPRPVEPEEWTALCAAANRVFRPRGAEDASPAGSTGSGATSTSGAGSGSSSSSSDKNGNGDGDGRDRDLAAESPLLFDPANREQMRIISRRGEIVAHAGYVRREALIYRRPVRVACVGAVFTIAGERGRGLGTRVLADVLARARRDADLVLASGDRTLYRRQGLEPAPPLGRFRIPAGTTAPVSLGVRACTAADIAGVAALYDAEDVHFVRPRADWERLLAAGMVVDSPGSVWLVQRGGRPVAYAAVQRAAPRPDGSLRPRRILEIAGDRSALVEAASLVAEELLVPAYDTSTLALCEGRGWVRTTRQFLITAEALSPEVRVVPWYGLNYL